MYANIITVMEANAIIHPITRVSQEYRQLITGDKKITWKRSFANESGQLDQGIRTIKDTNTLFLIPKHEVIFTTKKSRYEKLYATSNRIKLKHIAPG